jgi:hypothetical protein
MEWYKDQFDQWRVDGMPGAIERCVSGWCIVGAKGIIRRLHPRLKDAKKHMETQYKRNNKCQLN